jgi:hypothetical protein
MGGHLNVDIEDGQSPTAGFRDNTHLSGGLLVWVKPFENLKLDAGLVQRRDYSSDSLSGPVWKNTHSSRWQEERLDQSVGIELSDILSSNMSLNIQRRQVQPVSGGNTQYYLGEARLNGRYREESIITSNVWRVNEEQIPRYEYTYFEVDTGYGQYSYDPFISDYIPTPGGRFVRQRLYSDKVEQVRSIEGRSRIEYRRPTKGNDPRWEIRTALNIDTRDKRKVLISQVMQQQLLLGFSHELTRSPENLLKGILFTSRFARSSNDLYAYGSEAVESAQGGAVLDFQFNTDWSSEIGVEFEQRKRDLAYNNLAGEDWESVMLELQPEYQPSSRLILSLDLQAMEVQDYRTGERYLKTASRIKHTQRLGTRGRLDHFVDLARIEAEVDQLPYSQFQGLQPGSNWEYNLSGRYVFSQVFQVSLSLSVKQRGDRPQEEYLRLEGRTNF